MTFKTKIFGMLAVAAAAGAVLIGAAPTATNLGEVTFSKDIAPILQKKCQGCHQPGSIAPMSMMNYKETRPWAKSMKAKTGLRDKAGSMPPFYLERNIGIQHFKNDTGLSDLEVAKIAKWADTGAPEGNPADMPPPVALTDTSKWTLGEPDLIVSTPEVTMKSGAPDWWGELDPAPTGLTEDRWVKSLEMREINDTGNDGGRKTVGARFIFHHMIWTTNVPGGDLSIEDLGEGSSGTWPIHEVARNADVFPDDAGKLLRAGSQLIFASTHLHSNGRDTKSRLAYGFKFFPKGYQPKVKYTGRLLGNGVDIDILPGESNQRIDAYQVLTENTKITSYEPHMHAPGIRMCLEAIWGFNIQTLNCVGYDHNWVRTYEYEDDYAPLLPKGTIVHIMGFFDNTLANKNVPDPRNWSGAGNRSISNMFIDLGQGVQLTDEQFEAEMKARREKLHYTKNDVVLGCPLCNGDPIRPPQQKRPPSSAGSGNNQ